MRQITADLLVGPTIKEAKKPLNKKFYLHKKSFSFLN